MHCVGSNSKPAVGSVHAGQMGLASSSSSRTSREQASRAPLAANPSACLAVGCPAIRLPAGYQLFSIYQAIQRGLDSRRLVLDPLLQQPPTRNSFQGVLGIGMSPQVIQDSST